MKFQVIRPFSIVARGRRTEYKLGQRIGEAAYHRLTKTQQGRFLPARKCGAQSWTRDEYFAVAESYLKYGKNGYVQTIADFRKVSDRHSDNAIKIATYSCAHLDTTTDVDGLKDHANELLEVLQEMVPGRFTATGKVENIDLALDALLADIRG
jgi:hypothetical protein